MTIVVAGTIGQSVTGGQAWASMQYLAGFAELGHDVYYLEDCGDHSWVYDWDLGDMTADPEYPASYVNACLRMIGFEHRWIYRAGRRSLGMPLADFLAVCGRASVFIMRAVPMWVWRPEYDRPAHRIFIDVDPGFTQLNIAAGDEGLRTALDRCDHLFTFGQHIGLPECDVPVHAPWLKTLPPVSLPHWPAVADAGTHFTSIMRWQVGIPDAVHEGVTYGQKDLEFARFLDLPRLTGQAFRLALIGPESLREWGWETVPGEAVTRTPDAYRAFIQASRGEFGVAKHGYVTAKPGWFSDRSVCYLASGRPVLIQDTGLGDWLPVGDGVVAFSTLEEAQAGVARINADYDHHRRAARRVAEEYFAATRVLPKLLDDATR